MIIQNIKKPIIDSNQTSDLIKLPYKGQLFFSSVILNNLDEIKALREKGKYGTFGLNVNHIHVEENIENIKEENLYIDYKVEKLILSPEEAFYLVLKKILNVYNENDELLKPQELWNIFRKDLQFIFLYTAYEHFSEANWFVKPCTKYGGHFVLYNKSITHGPHVVFIELTGNLKNKYPKLFPECNYSSIIAQNRVLESAKKSMVLLLLDWPKNFQPDKGLSQLKKIELQFERFDDVFKLKDQLNNQENL